MRPRRRPKVVHAIARVRRDQHVGRRALDDLPGQAGGGVEAQVHRRVAPALPNAAPTALSAS